MLQETQTELKIVFLEAPTLDVSVFLEILTTAASVFLEVLILADYSF